MEQEKAKLQKDLARLAEEKIILWKVCKKVFGFFGILFVLYLLYKGATFFMPFFVAAILALITEPIIKFNMNKLKLSRRASSSIVVLGTILIVVGICVWSTTELVGWMSDIISNITKDLPNLSTSTADDFEEFLSPYEEYLGKDVIVTMSNSIEEFISNAGTYISGALGQALNMILSVPRMLVTLIITILAFVLFTKDRVTVIDMLEYHVPEKWLLKGRQIIKEIFTTLGDYIKVYSKILCITFIELIIAFSILNLIGLKIENHIFLAFVIAIVDILPVLGVGTVLIPWAVISFVMGNVPMGIAMLVVYFIILIIRQIIEPKLVSSQLGVHPLITLLAMYAGFKIIGFSGLIAGPFALVVLRCVYAKQIKKGLFKSFVED